MRFDETLEGDYRIYVGALEAPRGEGYTAALIVQRVKGAQAGQRDAFRDDSLACGYRWPTADEALHYAKNRGRDLVRSHPDLLTC